MLYNFNFFHKTKKRGIARKIDFCRSPEKYMSILYFLFSQKNKSAA